METYDLYINAKKPGIGLYVRHGSPLPEFAHPDDRRFDGEAVQNLSPPSVVEAVAADGHGCRDMD
ncbi:hypothetical protein [Brevundimonas sp.]|uniref:hypothetical protein n=1 Tax=Brevundimonas sp. TaxID=1871086 RepID=UPI001AC6A923|nr:hypothetical protein [Brevundimonas sp.]MBN9466780.1 hypothetical protein [Brevundimonas sp.]